MAKSKPKPKIRDYNHFKELRLSKKLKNKDIDGPAMEKYDIGQLQLYAWEARYKNERRTEKALKK